MTVEKETILISQRAWTHEFFNDQGGKMEDRRSYYYEHHMMNSQYTINEK